MVIKAMAVNAAHGRDVIGYDIKKDKAKIIKIQALKDTIFGFPSPEYVYAQMRSQQEFVGKKCKDPFFRVEICPSAEESKGWTEEDWLKLCDDTIAKFKKHEIDLSNTQLMCVLHRDTGEGKWHVHLVANRITMDGSVINAWQCKTKAHAVADAIAKERKWILASDVKKPVRKSEIRQDAYSVLSKMDKFDIRTFFANMRAKGYIIQDRWSMEKCVGYSIGKEKKVMFKSSALSGRDLMPSRIEETWKKIRIAQAQQEQEREVKQEEKTFIPKVEEKHTEMVFYEYTTDYDGQIPFSIPKVLDDVIQKEIKVPDELYDDSDLERDEDWDAELADRPRVARGAAAILVGLMLPNGSDGSAVGGGGGGVQDELSRWDGLPVERQDEYISWARRAAHEANEYYRPQKVERSRSRYTR